MRMIQLHKVPRQQYEPRPDSYRDTDDVGEPQEVAALPAASPVTINVDAIRCFYPRHAERGPGTRITFNDGGGFAVTESYDEVVALTSTH